MRLCCGRREACSIVHASRELNRVARDGRLPNSTAGTELAICQHDLDVKSSTLRIRRTLPSRSPEYVEMTVEIKTDRCRLYGSGGSAKF